MQNNRIMLRTVSIFLLCTLIFGLGCSQQEDRQPASLEEILQDVADDTAITTQYQAEPPYVVGFSNASMGNPWRAFFDAWIRYQVSQYEEIENLIRTDAQDDPVKQISDIEDLIARDVDVLVVSATDQQALAPAVENAMDAGIPVILVDRGVRTEEFVSFIGASDSDMGRIMAEELVTMMGESGNVVLLSGVAGSSPVEMRLEAARKVFDEYSDIQVVGHSYTGWQSSRAKSAMEGFIQANPQIDGIWADSGLLSWPALEALEESGREFVPATGDHLIGFSQFLQEHNIPGVQVRFPATMGGRAIDVAMQVLQGRPVPRYRKVQLEVIHSKDLAKYNVQDKPENWWVGEYEGLPKQFMQDF